VLRPLSASVRNLNREISPVLSGVALTSNPEDIVNDPDIDVIIEVMGGDEPARSLLLQAIANGKHVVTANKALIACHGSEIFEAARKHDVSVAFEAAVAGGIPVIKSIREGLAGNKIHWVAGIINGTCNYILTEMLQKGREFDDVLQEAKALGYAEADPTFDIEGIDAAHKLTILASIAFGVPLQFDAVHIEGISDIAREDTAYAQELGYRIKHLGLAVDTGNGIELRVQRVASASVDNRVPMLAFQHDALVNSRTMKADEFETAFYLRITAEDKPGVMADISRLLADEEISIEAILQKEPAEGSNKVPIILLTRKIVEGAMNRAIVKLQALDSVEGKVTRIRMETLAGT